MDVLEHLPDPINTMRRCLELLKHDGTLIIQTPRYPEGKTYEDLSNTHDPFLEQLKANEHLYLFSQSSIREFFHGLGADYLAFEPAVFAHYDMFVIVSRLPLAANSWEQADQALSDTANGRLIQALLDLNSQFQQVAQQYADAEADRAAHLNSIDQLTRLLQESEADQAARLDSINQLTLLLQESEVDRAARLNSIDHLTRLLQESEVDRAARLNSIDHLTRLMQESEVDRAARLANIKELTRLLQESEADRAARLATVNELTRLLQESEADRVAQYQAISDQRLQLKQLRRDHSQLQSSFVSQTNVVTEQQILLDKVEQSEIDYPPRVVTIAGNGRW